MGPTTFTASIHTPRCDEKTGGEGKLLIGGEAVENAQAP